MNKNNETIDWNALIDEYKSNQNFISMIDFCNHHHVSIDDMKYHYHKQKSDHTKKVIELRSISMNKNSFIQLEYNGFSEYFTKKMTAFHSFDDVITLV
ncbi:hypothetical protein B5F09_12200 [Erysipelatoclostridium sp. An173]|uniref:hypothetical protein n=1 Tax=Erysipelatoclostridium sp. An173 TaxID=1965571 RepID=UPI000B3A63E3|nr:hypothetical protein [Erysipelatoclostridium sp. An173]OUP72896.1 hypothetical protein B5F09_12200 [Erysipelatoclostridium sp. An173]